MNQRSRQIAITFKDAGQVVEAYMPFLRDGGFFIPTEREFSLGDELFIVLTLPDNPKQRSPAPAKVVWINPPKASGGRKQGIGVAFTGVQAPTINNRFKKIIDQSGRRSMMTNTM